MQQKIVITGGPGTGKSTLINELRLSKYYCMPEISRQITLTARKNGVKQLFLKNPLRFSNLLLDGRVQQFKNAEKEKAEIIFFDRGIPDVHGYMNYLGVDYPDIYKDMSEKYRYSFVFMTPPWEEIYHTDNERYESFEQSLVIHNHLKKTYLELDYFIFNVPKGNIKERTRFILNTLSE